MKPMPALPTNRRAFLRQCAALSALASLNLSCRKLGSQPTVSKTKPVRGSWLSIWWDDRRHFYWNDACLAFSAEQWQLAVKDMADLGFRYVVLLAVAKGGKAFYDTPVLPKLKMGCADPLEALLTAGDRYGVRFFISSDWYGEWDEKALLDSQRMELRYQMMDELAARYARHRSFYGWYWPNEACLTPYFTDQFIEHVNACSAHARRLTPGCKTLTAPYGTRTAVCDQRFIEQLERLDVDIIAYQDEVGCLRMNPDESAAAFSRLRQAHDKVPQRALWADVEVFAWEGPPNQQSSPLIPAPFSRVLAQLAAVSPYVDEVLIYQFQGLMNRPDSRAFVGHPASTTLYTDYAGWLRREHPRLNGL
jgi:hypothetical protein